MENSSFDFIRDGFTWIESHFYIVLAILSALLWLTDINIIIKLAASTVSIIFFLRQI